MLCKTVTYEDFDGLERTENFYFNLTKTELTEMNLSKQGGYADYLNAIVAAKDAPTLARLFKELLLKGYGVKSEDGRRFYKTPELTKDFEASAAYDVIYGELISSEEAAADFFIRMLPNSLQEQVRAEVAKQKEAK